MDFQLSKEQEDIRKAAESFAEGEFDPDLISEWERQYRFPIEVWQKACELGFIGMQLLLMTGLCQNELIQRYKGIGLLEWIIMALVR